MSELKPIYGYGFFNVRENGLVDETIIFLYSDPDAYYKRVMRDRSKYTREIEILSRNMQYFLDEEKVYINNERVYPILGRVDIGVAGLDNIAYIIFNIYFKGVLKKGLNTYVNEYKQETAEYDYTVYWFFPENARIVKAVLNVPYEVILYGRGLRFIVYGGTRLPGREEIIFEIN